MTQTQLDTLVIGAGLSGILAARELKAAGKRVLLLDKGRSVGGRLATRRIGGGVADHGAQFFTTRETKFREMLERWLIEGLAFEWSRGWSDGSIVSTRDGHPRYAIHGGMNKLAKHLAQGLDVRTKVEIVSVRADGTGWQATDDHGSTVRASSLLLTPPVPQSLALLDAAAVALNESDRAALEKIEYDPCLCGMFVLDKKVRLPAPGAIQRPHANIYWIADNQQKGISSVPILTAQASAPYSRNLWDRKDEDILDLLRVDLMPILGDDVHIVEEQLKRWRYSQPRVTHPDSCLVAADVPAPLVFAGDAFGGPRVEGAALSGIAAGKALVEKLG